MVFSSLTFLFIFLPIMLLCYYSVPFRFKNSILLLFSLIFYSFGEPKYIFLLLISCFVNYVLTRLMDGFIGNKRRYGFIIIIIVFNIMMLGYFKYFDFMIKNINSLLNTSFSLQYIILPIGISFYTFQCLSYVIDVYFQKVEVNKNMLSFFTYVCLFPQLIAGPIVRYRDVHEQLKNRDHTFDKCAQGITRFVIGLSKKVLLANQLGEFVSFLQKSEMTWLSAWLICIGFILQLYFDFSGYSDMAIGLGKMLGFDFLENFNYPLTASSITDFWRRWHISLSSWFKDYVYIPLKGSRVKPLRLCFNLIIVWLLTGLWHGASWNFVIWGVFFAVVLIIEKLFIHSWLKTLSCFKYLYTWLILCVGFCFFIYSIDESLKQLSIMFFIQSMPILNPKVVYYLQSYGIIFIIACIAALPKGKQMAISFRCSKYYKNLGYLEVIGIWLLFILCILFIVDASFNPFLYFRF